MASSCPKGTWTDAGSGAHGSAPRIHVRERKDHRLQRGPNTRNAGCGGLAPPPPCLDLPAVQSGPLRSEEARFTEVERWSPRPGDPGPLLLLDARTGCEWLGRADSRDRDGHPGETGRGRGVLNHQDRLPPQYPTFMCEQGPRVCTG